ncbi:MAG: 4Fe-4S dicluster domain-containing protein [Clostridium sp.]|nr:4Fe-4S dicluster domain-containing protein [Clostridium sp.]
MFNVDREKCIACQQCIKDCPATDIYLKEGKAHIKNENCIKCGHCVAICPTKAISTDDYDMDEVIEYNKETFNIPSENLLNFIKFRRSVRRFKDIPVEKEKLEQIIEAGRFTQTSRNIQDVSYIVVTDDKLQELSDLSYEILKKKGEYILENMTPEKIHLKRYAMLWTQMYSAYKGDRKKHDRLFCNAPAAIIVTAKEPFNGALASSNMELMVDTLGLGTFFNGFFKVAAEDNKEIQDFLKIEDDKQIVSCLVIGYPDVRYKRTVPRGKANINWL